MKLLGTLLVLEAGAASTHHFWMKLCTEGNGVKNAASGELRKMKVSIGGTGYGPYIIDAPYHSYTKGLFQSKAVFMYENINWATSKNIEVNIVYESADILCFEEFYVEDSMANRVDLVEYLPIAATPDWPTSADKVFFMTNECDPMAFNNGRELARIDSFKQTCRDALQFNINTEVNECADPTLNMCDDNADCTDTPTGYECECHAGFVGTGMRRNFEPKEGCTVDTSAPKTTVTCNDGDAVKMTATVPKSLSPDKDLSELTGWTDDGTNYVASWEPASFTDAEITEETRQAGQVLVLTKDIEAPCAPATVEGVTVCLKTGHDLSFKCEYSLDDQTLDEKAFTVSGSDSEDTAVNTGTLKYNLAVDNAAVTIGSSITATITPVNKNLVDATIKSCSVKHTGNKQSVNIINANLQPECDLGAAIATGQGQEELIFSWSAFKWTTTKDSNDDDVVEDQQVSCTIELAKAATPKTAGTCNNIGG